VCLNRGVRTVLIFLVLFSGVPLPWGFVLEASEEPPPSASTCASRLTRLSHAVVAAFGSELPSAIVKPVRFTLKALGYPIYGVVKSIAGFNEWARGRLPSAEVGGVLVNRLNEDKWAIAAFAGIYLFTQSATISPYEIESATRDYVDEASKGKVVVVNGFPPGSGLFESTRLFAETRFRSSERVVHLAQSDVVPPNFDPGTSDIETWGYILLALMREVKSTGKTIDFLDLHFHGDEGEMCLFEQDALVTVLALSHLSALVDEVNNYPSGQKLPPLLATIREEQLPLTLFSPGAVVRIQGCQFAGSPKGAHGAVLVARSLLGERGGVALFSRVLITRDYPETIGERLGLPAFSASPSVNFQTRIVGTPFTLLRYVVNGLAEGEPNPIHFPTKRILEVPVLPGTKPAFHDVSVLIRFGQDVGTSSGGVQRAKH
jgi:hypothetical protein